MESLPVKKIEHVTDEEQKWPGGLKKAKEVAEQMGISEERLLELAEAHLAPHWRIENGEPLFQISEVKKWASKNILNRFNGKDLPVQLRVMIMPPEPADAPLEIREIKGLREVPIYEYPPGVYFLVKDNKVVYVGQSVNPIARVGTHRGDKSFTHAYMIPVPSSLLDSVEGSLIRAMNPPLNSGNRQIAVGPGNKKEDGIYLEKFAEGLVFQQGR